MLLQPLCVLWGWGVTVTLTCLGPLFSWCTNWFTGLLWSKLQRLGMCPLPTCMALNWPFHLWLYWSQYIKQCVKWSGWCSFWVSGLRLFLYRELHSQWCHETTVIWSSLTERKDLLCCQSDRLCISSLMDTPFNYSCASLLAISVLFRPGFAGRIQWLGGSFGFLIGVCVCVLSYSVESMVSLVVGGADERKT